MKISVALLSSFLAAVPAFAQDGHPPFTDNNSTPTVNPMSDMPQTATHVLPVRPATPGQEWAQLGTVTIVMDPTQTSNGVVRAISWSMRSAKIELDGKSYELTDVKIGNPELTGGTLSFKIPGLNGSFSGSSAMHFDPSGYSAYLGDLVKNGETQRVRVVTGHRIGP